MVRELASGEDFSEFLTSYENLISTGSVGPLWAEIFTFGNKGSAAKCLTYSYFLKGPYLR